MKRIVLTKEELEAKVERVLENACAYHSIGHWKNAYRNYCEAMTYLDLLEDMGIYYDKIVINDHVHRMIEILEDDTIFTVTAMQRPL